LKRKLTAEFNLYREARVEKVCSEEFQHVVANCWNAGEEKYFNGEMTLEGSSCGHVEYGLVLRSE